MKHYREELVHEHTKRVESHATCDNCGAVIVDEVWSGQCREYDEIELKRTKGTSWPGDSDAEHWHIDCCAACWEAKVLPLFPLAAKPEQW